MADRNQRNGRREISGFRTHSLLLSIVCCCYAFFLPWTYLSAGMSEAGLGIPGLERAFAFTSVTYYGFLSLSYFGAFCLLVILFFISTLNRLVVSFMIVAPLGVIHLNRWYSLQHFPEVWPM